MEAGDGVTHWRTMIEKDFLGAWDFLHPETGKPCAYTLKIVSVKSEILKTREQPKGKRRIVIRFEGWEKGFVCNTTNAETIESMYGADIDQWIGKSVTLTQRMVRSPKGGEIPGIRVFAKKPTGPATTADASRPVDEKIRAAQNEAFDREPGADDA
jgi:hypothetical protein